MVSTFEHYLPIFDIYVMLKIKLNKLILKNNVSDDNCRLHTNLILLDNFRLLTKNANSMHLKAG